MKNFLFPLNAIHRNGEVILLYTLDEVYAFVRKYGRFYDHHVDWHWYFDNGRYCEYTKPNDWIVRDDRGRTVKYDDISGPPSYNYWINKRNAEIRKIAEKGLPIPYTGCSKAGYKQNHTAKKNSGSGHRNRNRARCQYDQKEYGIKNKYGKPIPYEGW